MGRKQRFFDNASQKLKVGAGDVRFAYVDLDAIKRRRVGRTRHDRRRQVDEPHTIVSEGPEAWLLFVSDIGQETRLLPPGRADKQRAKEEQPHPCDCSHGGAVIANRMPSLTGHPFLLPA